MAKFTFGRRVCAIMVAVAMLMSLTTVVVLAGPASTCPIHDDEGIEIYDLAKDATIEDLTNATVGAHSLFRAPAGGTLAGTEAPSVTLTDRTGNSQGIDICVTKLNALVAAKSAQGLALRFEIIGTTGANSTNDSALRFVRPSGSGGETVEMVRTAVPAGTFDINFTASSARLTDTAATGLAGGSLIFRIGTNNAATNSADLAITKLVITALKESRTACGTFTCDLATCTKYAANICGTCGECVTRSATVFDMQNLKLAVQEPTLASTAGGGQIATTATNGFLSSHNQDTGFVEITANPTTIILTNRNGVGQALRLRAEAINAVANHLYRIEYTAELSAVGQPRIRIEGGSGLAPFNGGATFDATSVLAETPFTHSVSIPAAQIAPVGTGNGISLSTVNATANITYTDVKVIQVCPGGCDAPECAPATGLADVTGYAIVAVAIFATSAALWAVVIRRKRNNI